MASYLPRSLNMRSGRGKESRVRRLRKVKWGFSLWLTRMCDRSLQVQRSLTNLCEILVLLFQHQHRIIHSVGHIGFYFAVCLCNCSWCHIVHIMSAPSCWWLPMLFKAWFLCRLEWPKQQKQGRELRYSSFGGSMRPWIELLNFLSPSAASARTLCSNVPLNLSLTSALPSSPSIFEHQALWRRGCCVQTHCEEKKQHISLPEIWLVWFIFVF